jgi:hypothetical protein
MPWRVTKEQTQAHSLMNEESGAPDIGTWVLLQELGAYQMLGNGVRRAGSYSNCMRAPLAPLSSRLR